MKPYFILYFPLLFKKFFFYSFHRNKGKRNYLKPTVFNFPKNMHSYIYDPLLLLLLLVGYVWLIKAYTLHTHGLYKICKFCPFFFFKYKNVCKTKFVGIYKTHLKSTSS